MQARDQRTILHGRLADRTMILGQWQRLEQYLGCSVCVRRTGETCDRKACEGRQWRKPRRLQSVTNKNEFCNHESVPNSAGDANSSGILSPSRQPVSVYIFMQFCMNSASESREDPAHFNALPPKRRTAAAMTIALHLISFGAFERKEPRDSIQASFEMQLSPRCESSGASIASEIAPNHFDTSSALILHYDSARDSARCFNDPAQCSAIRCAA